MKKYPHWVQCIGLEAVHSLSSIRGSCLQLSALHSAVHQCTTDPLAEITREQPTACLILLRN